MMSNSSITPFKERELNYSQSVDVYRCLNRKGTVFSIKQKSLVVAHATELEMKNVNFIVNPAGKKKAITSKIKNVHAFIRGKIGRHVQEEVLILYPLVYDSFSEKGFIIEGEEVGSSPMVTIRTHGIYAMKPLQSFLA